jgi:ribosomal small subunit protein bTHX
MGKGDKKSKKGKRFKASFGNSRKRMAIKNRLKKNAVVKPVAEVVAAVEEKPKAKRTPRKKTEAAE